MKKFFSGQESEEILRATGLFDGFERAELEAALEFLNAKSLTYEKGACIMLAGNRQACGLVLSGLVQITAEDYYGNRSIMSKAGAGELFGEVFACAGIAEAPVSVFAAERTQIMFLNCGLLLQESAAGAARAAETAGAARIVDAARTDGGQGGRELETERLQQVLTRNLLRIVAQKALFLNRKIEFLSRRTTREKLLAYLSAQARAADSRQFTIPFNRQELADFLCVERSAMSAELGRMKRDGLLDFERRTFRLL